MQCTDLVKMKELLRVKVMQMNICVTFVNKYGTLSLTVIKNTLHKTNHFFNYYYFGLVLASSISLHYWDPLTLEKKALAEHIMIYYDIYSHAVEDVSGQPYCPHHPFHVKSSTAGPACE